jgi:hypothetical protein
MFTPIFDGLDPANATFACIDIRGYGNSRDVSGSHATRHYPMQETPIHLAARLVSLISESDSNS